MPDNEPEVIDLSDEEAPPDWDLEERDAYMAEVESDYVAPAAEVEILVAADE